MKKSQNSLEENIVKFSFSQEIIATCRCPTPLPEQETLDHDKKADDVISSELFKTPIRLTRDMATSLPKTDDVELRNDLTLYDVETTSGQTKVKIKTHERILLIKQTKTEERKYEKLKRSGETKMSKLKALSKGFGKEQDTQNTPPSQAQQDDGQSQPYHSQCRETGLISKRKNKRKNVGFMHLKEYVANKTLKSDTKYFQEKVELYDKIKKEFVEFRVFKESDLCHSKFIQGLLKETHMDDDCPTDIEQLEFAINFGNKQLKQALDLQNQNSRFEASVWRGVRKILKCPIRKRSKI